MARGIVSSELFAPLTILVLIIVAILSFVVIYRGAKQPSSLVAAGASTTVEQLDVRGGQESQSSPYDALQHLIIEPHHFNSLEIHRAFTPWRMLYPIYVRNTRPFPVDIVEYNANILWNLVERARITWRSPDSEASNGISLRSDNTPVEALTIQGDSSYTLHVTTNGSGMAPIPLLSPQWGMRGTIYFRCGTEERAIQFNFNTDNYQAVQSEWPQWHHQLNQP